jgi:hypothetical protein
MVRDEPLPPVVLEHAPAAFAVTAGEARLRVWDPGDGWLKVAEELCLSATPSTST